MIQNKLFEIKRNICIVTLLEQNAVLSSVTTKMKNIYFWSSQL